MRIGIVTPAFNVAPFIGDTIRSVLAQTHRDWTMIVVDDGSTDGTAAVARGLADPRLRVISQANAGVSAARNRGAALVDAAALLFLDGDDELAPFALEALATDLTPAATVVVGAYARGGRVYPPPSGDLLPRLLVRNPFVNGGHLLIRRDAMPPFREDLRYGEDWECWVRLALTQRPTTPLFAPAAERRPVLFVRERPSGAYLTMATDPTVSLACLAAIHDNPALDRDWTPRQRAALRRAAAADSHWIAGRELIRHDRPRDGLRWMGQAVREQPSARRAMLLSLAAGMALLPAAWRGPLRPYPSASGTVQAS